MMLKKTSSWGFLGYRDGWCHKYDVINVISSRDIRTIKCQGRFSLVLSKKRVDYLYTAKSEGQIFHYLRQSRRLSRGYKAMDESPPSMVVDTRPQDDTNRDYDEDGVFLWRTVKTDKA